MDFFLTCFDSTIQIVEPTEAIDLVKPLDKRCKICGKYAAKTDIKSCNELCDKHNAYKMLLFNSRCT